MAREATSHYVAVFLKACLNGARTPDEHRALPVTAHQVALNVTAVLQAGADAVHVHIKDHHGHDTLADAPAAATLLAVREHSPDVRVGVTTGEWIDPDPAVRAAAITSWSVLPDFASVNWHEDGAELVAEALLQRGIGVEAGLWTLAAVRAWASSPLRGHCTRVLLELPDGLTAGDSLTRADELLAALPEDVQHIPVLLHGEGSSTWPLLVLAARQGLQARIGLEDTLELPDGSPATSNAELVTCARALTAGEHGERFT